MERKLFLLCCLCIISIVTSKHTKYEKGKTYKYNYAGFLFTGSPDLSNFYTGFFIHTQVHLSYIKDKGMNRIFSLQFINPRITKVADDISPVYPDRFDSPFKFKQQKWHKRYNGLSRKTLELPVEFAWSKMGHVKSMRKSSKDKRDSLNIKRSVLSMLCGNYGAIPPGHGTGLKILGSTKMVGVDGNCKTASTFQKISGSTFEFTKIRSLHECSKMPSIKISNFPKAFRVKCTPERRSRANANSNTKVLLQRKTTDTYFIDKIQGYSRYEISGPFKACHSLITRGSQELRFEKIVPKGASKKKSFNKGYQTASLIMDLPSEPKASKSNKKFMKEVNSVLKIMRANKLKAKFVKQQLSLIRLLRKASVAQIEQVLKQRSTRSTVKKLLSAVGTKASIKVLIRLLRDTKVPQEVSAILVIDSATTASNPDLLAYEFRKLVKENIFATPRHRKTWKALLLGTGTLIGAMNRGNQKSLANKARYWFNKLMKADFSKLMKEEEKTVVLLKSIGNTGFHQLSDIFITYIKSGKSLTIRLAAMRAWRKFVGKVRRLTVYTMIPIFANQNEDTEIRINAFLIMMRASPRDRAQIGYFSHLLMRETDVNVRNFVMSSLLLISRIGDKSRCFLGMKITARKVLRRLPRRFQEIDKSKSMMFFNPLRTFYWADVFGYIIYTKDSMLPRSIYFTDALVKENSVAKTFEIQIRSLNNHGSIRKLAGRMGFLKKVMRSEANSAKFRSKRSTAGKKTGSLVFELSLFGEDVMAEERETSEVIVKMFKNLDISSGSILEDYHVQPTAFGLPLMIDRSMGHVGKLVFKPEKVIKEGQFSLETFTTWSEAYMITGSLGTSIGKTHSKAALDIRANINPGGKASIKSKTKVSKGSLASQISLLPSGKTHKLVDLYQNCYLLIGTEKSSKLKRIDMTASRNVPSFTKVYKSGIKGLPQVKVRRTTWDPKFNLPSFVEITVLRAPVFGISFELKSENAEAKESNDEFIEEPEPQIEVLRAVKSSRKSDAKAFLLPYSAGSTLFLKDRNKKLKFKFNYLVRQRKRRSKTVTILYADASYKSKKGSFISFDMTVSNKAKQSFIKATGKAKNTGAPVFFDPDNPFQVTSNMRRSRQLTLSVGGQTLFSLNGTSEMSNRWVKRWKSLLKSPRLISREYSQIQQCIKNGQQNSDYSNSPNCIDAWELLQVFDSHKVHLNFIPSLGPHLKVLNNKVSKSLERYFTKFKWEAGTNQAKAEMWISPMDEKGLRHLKLYRIMRRKLRSSSTCDVGIYQSNRRLIVNSFDGNRYDTLVSSKLFKDRSLIIAQERSRSGNFTVAFSYGKDPSTLIHFDRHGKVCTIKVLPSSDAESETDIEGPGCSDNYDRDTYTIDVGSPVVRDAVKVAVPDLKFTVVTRPTRYVRVTAKISFYLYATRGVCGNFDGLAQEGEFLGKSCKRHVFTDLKEFANDYVVKNPTQVPTCS